MAARRSALYAKPGKKLSYYLISIGGLVFTILLIVLALYFRDEVQRIGGYGYVGVFIVGVLCGLTVIPLPTLLMVFTLGSLLNPTYVGLVAGLGGAIGGITVYLTGAGAETIWSRLRRLQPPIEEGPGQQHDIIQPVQSEFWSIGEGVHRRLEKWMGGRTGALVLFITSAMIISPFYFAALAAGTVRIGLLRFFLITWAGKTIKYLTISFAGFAGINVLIRLIEGS